MVLVAYNAIDIAFNAQGTFSVGPKWLPPITIIAFALMMFWIVYDLKKANERLLDSRPKIEVDIVQEQYTYYLKVQNDGAQGMVKAQFQLTSKEPSVWPLPVYYGHWRLANGSEAPIMKGHYDMVKLAEKVISQKGDMSCLHIFYHDTSTNSERFITTSSYAAGWRIVNQDGSTMQPTKWDYNLRLSLTSSPSPVEGALIKQYGLNVDGLKEVNFVPLTPDSGGSRT